MRWLAVVLFTLLAPAALRAQVLSVAPDDAEVVIYRGPAEADVEDDASFGLAMITETRTIVLPAGPAIIKFQGVAEGIVPQTAKLEGLATPITESNFDYDLLSPGSLIAKAIGAPVRIVRTNRKTGSVTEQRAILRSGPEGVVLDADGHVEALGCSGEDERLVFDSAPANLTDKPTLSMSVNVPAGRYQVRLSYLTLGMNWAADYVAKLNPDGRTLELTGWITLTNKLATSYRNVPVKVIAGDLSFFADETTSPGASHYEQDAVCWPVGSFYQSTRRFYEMQDLRSPNAPMMMLAKAGLEEVVVTGSFIAKQSELGDYKLYSLPERTTVAANQTKQVRMLEKRMVSFERLYVYEYYDEGLRDIEQVSPTTVLRLQNKTNAGLGLPLPAGVVSVMEPSGPNRLVLAGEHAIDDIPIGLPIEIATGQAMDVWVRPRVVSDQTIDGGTRRRRRLQIEFVLGNDKSIATNMELRHNLDGEEDVRISAESKRHVLRSGDARWSMTLRPGERTILRYTVEYNR